LQIVCCVCFFKISANSDIGAMLIFQQYMQQHCECTFLFNAQTIYYSTKNFASAAP
jgi:hypothetical protein